MMNVAEGLTVQDADSGMRGAQQGPSLRMQVPFEHVLM